MKKYNNNLNNIKNFIYPYNVWDIIVNNFIIIKIFQNSSQEIIINLKKTIFNNNISIIIKNFTTTNEFIINKFNIIFTWKISDFEKKEILNIIKNNETKFFFIKPKLVLKLEVTNYCNSNCIFCPSISQKRKKWYLTIWILKKILLNYSWYKLEFVIEWLWEPLLNKSLLNIIKFLFYYDEFTNIRLMTNWILLDNKFLEKLAIIVSNKSFVIDVNIPSLRREVYKKLTGVNIDSILFNLKYLKKNETKFNYRIIFLVNKLNIVEIWIFKKLFWYHLNLIILWNRFWINNKEIIDKAFLKKFWYENKFINEEKIFCTTWMNEKIDQISYNYNWNVTFCYNQLINSNWIKFNDVNELLWKLNEFRQKNWINECKNCSDRFTYMIHEKIDRNNKS